MSDAEKAAENFCASVKHDNTNDFDESAFLMWGNTLAVDAVACNIENPESCETCSG